MYIRSKNRKNSSKKITKYAYLVKSKRRKKSKKHPKQKVVAYLGRVIELNNHQQSSTIINNDMSKTIISMISQILLSNSFKPHNNAIFTRGTIVVDLSKRQVKDLKSNKNICLQINEGFISNHTLKEILDYQPIEATEKKIGMDLAKRLLAVGLKPQKKDFISLYNLISKDFHRK
tara:strand:+ start:998 stop:1522 length:525 start_codon:yes stop_codon:yes gene_type:complete